MIHFHFFKNIYFFSSCYDVWGLLVSNDSLLLFIHRSTHKNILWKSINSFDVVLKALIENLITMP